LLSRTTAVAGFALMWPGATGGVTCLDLVPFVQVTSWLGSQPHRFADLKSAGKADNIGLEWDEERDVREIRVRFRGEAQKRAVLEYWFKNWPWDPPKMPIEDPMDDPWQGEAVWHDRRLAPRIGGSHGGFWFPRNALTAQDGIRVDNVQTFFAPVSYSLHGSEAGVIEGEVTLHSGKRRKKLGWSSVRHLFKLRARP
jgi:hypothetical protein